MTQEEREHMTELSMNRRRFLGAAAGAVAGAGILGGLRLEAARAGVLVPTGKRSIILFTVRDRIGAAPDATGIPYGFAQVLERLAEIGYHGIEFAGYNQNTPSSGGRSRRPRSARSSTTTA